MALATILVVEDESIVARDLQSRLRSLGYDVPAVAATGEEALKKAADIRPDLVLMDIRLKGAMDGIETAEQLRELFNVPPVYLTAYTDSETLRRAKITEPFGYIVKPFDERELHSAIEMALYRHKTETKLRQSEQWLAAILRSTGDGVIAASKAGLVVSMNPVAEELTGWTQEAAVGREVTAVFQIIRQETREPAENPAMEVLRGGAGVTLTKGFCLVSRNGKEKPVDCRAIPVRDDQEALTGVFVVLRELAPGAP